MTAKAESERFWNAFSLANNCVPLFNLLQETPKHRLFIEAPIVTEAVFVQVGLQIVTANRMIDATNSGFHERPEAFNCVRVNLADHVDALAMIDSLMLVSASVKPVVGAEGIGKHSGLREHMFFDESTQGVGFNIGCDEGPNLPFTLDHTDYRSFLGSASACSFGTAPVIRFVHFDLATESANRPALFVTKHGADLFEHAPRRFIGDASLALNLRCGDAATGSGHEVDRIEPSRQRSWRLVKDRVSGRMHMIAAMLTAVRRAAGHAVMLCDLLAFLAKDAVRIETVLEPFEAGGIVGELCLEGF